MPEPIAVSAATTTVLVVPIAMRAFADFLLPQTGRIAEGGGNIYLFYTIGHGAGARDSTYADPTNGEVLIESRTFETLAEADWWVRNEIGRVA